MTYNFSIPTERRNSACMKWDERPEVSYPLWVADMDFRVCPAIVEALQARVDHAIFGYAVPPESFYESIINWHRRNHQVIYDRNWFIVVPGIVPAISAVLRAMTRPGDGVLTLSPVYNCFYSSIRNLQCRAEESVLVREGDTFRIDFDDLERRASLPDVSVMLLCSPHNPCGRIWTQEELRRIADICLRHNVFLVSDEIHCELTMPGRDFTPLLSLGEPFASHVCVCTSASKTFNIAGLQNAQIIVPDEAIRQKIDRAVNIHEICDVNPFGIVATEAAYNQGEEWLIQLRDYIWGNYQAAREILQADNSPFRVMSLEATYLMWVDITATGTPSEEFCENLLKSKSIWLSAGPHYGNGGEGYVRINLATQRERLTEAMHRMVE